MEVARLRKTRNSRLRRGHRDMTMWVLLIALNVSHAMAFKSQEDCHDAASKLKVPAVCIAFAADIPEGKKL